MPIELSQFRARAAATLRAAAAQLGWVGAAAII
jgi:hypothetical protein